MVQGANGGRQRERKDGTYSIGEDAGLTRRSNQSSCHEETMSERRTERHSGTCWVMSSLQFHQGSPGPSVENETISEQSGVTAKAAAEEESPEPETIIPQSCIIGALSFDLEDPATGTRSRRRASRTYLCSINHQSTGENQTEDRSVPTAAPVVLSQDLVTRDRTPVKLNWRSILGDIGKSFDDSRQPVIVERDSEVPDLVSLHPCYEPEFAFG
ncbi:hypothetical protein AMECASPLE_004349 [Ameca splendens]|uniref:Uncharacterized protein n=1 Tax=Ameca splendens TaxID=208324 RepID=A0ABV0ZVQ5_9TELE